MPERRTPAGRWTYGSFYLDRPHADRGGFWYACRYDAGNRRVARRSLRTTDFEQAKVELVAIADVAPVASEEAPHPRNVGTMTCFAAYLAGHGASIRTEDYAKRVETLVHDYLKGIGKPTAPVAFWTPSRLIEFAKHLATDKGHKASTIERILNVLSAVFHDAAAVKMRQDPFGQAIEGSLMSHAPKVRIGKTEIASALRLPNQRPKIFVPSFEEMATFLDALNYEHLRRWALIALSTWARPEAITDFDPETQWDRRTNALDLNVPGRSVTNKRRALILMPQSLQLALPAWRAADQARRGSRADEAWFPLMRGRRRIESVKRGVKLTAADIGLPGITQKTPRTFMATQARRLCPRLPRELRSRWLGHAVEEGSKTTDHYEKFEAADLADVALATDYVLHRLHRLCRKPLLAIEPRLNHEDLRRLGASDPL